jgi:hypothetical protein
MQGSITWYPVATNKPPIADYQSVDNIKRSANLLVWGPGGWVWQTYYIHMYGKMPINKWFGITSVPFEITHYAFINFPDPY